MPFLESGEAPSSPYDTTRKAREFVFACLSCCDHEF
jgi:hypothetical protein